jgi:transposase
LVKLAWIFCAAALALALPFGAGAGPNSRPLYKWVDAQGVTHYGDQIPPEYAGQEQHVINSQGVEVGHTDAQKSPEQLAAEDQRRADAALAQQRDHNLMSTYASVQEIERLRDQRLQLVTDQIRVTSQFLDSLNSKLRTLRASSMQYKPYNGDPKAAAMPDQMADDLVHVGNDIRTQEQNLRAKQAEASTMSKQFESDIARFKELKGIH